MAKRKLTDSISAVHPGEILKNLLVSKEMSQKELAAAIGKSTPVVNDLLSGKRDINVEIAILLETVFELPQAEEWLQYQSSYDLEKTRQSEKVMELQKAITNWKSLDEVINLRVIKKRAGLGASVVNDLDFLYKLYNVEDADALRISLSQTRNTACFKKSEALQNDERNINTWILLTRISDAKRLLETKFNLNCVQSLISRLNDVFYRNLNVLREVESILRDFGIKFIVEKKLEKVPVDGYSFWQGENPTIVVTTRSSLLDNLAFTIYHELGHIILHLSKDRNIDFLDAIEGAKKSAQEIEANEFASKSIWKNFDFYSLFAKIQQPFGATPILKRLSEKLHIHEGIIAGQYQHYLEDIKHPTPYAVCSKLKVKFQ